MGAHICGYCNCVPCQCKEDKRVDDNDVKPTTGGYDGDEPNLVIGRVVPAPGIPDPTVKVGGGIEERKVIAGPDGEGCVQEITFEGRPIGEPQFPPLMTKPAPTPTPLSVKSTNPKDAVGTKKWRQYCTVPTTIIWELGVAMLEGARKYGRHNYRIAGVRASVYVDAAKGHIDQWWEGEDIDKDSQLSHITKAVASLVVLRDAMIQDRWVDDRPPKTDLDKLRTDLQRAVDSIFERVPEAKDAYLEGDQYK